MCRERVVYFQQNKKRRRPRKGKVKRCGTTRANETRSRYPAVRTESFTHPEYEYVVVEAIPQIHKHLYFVFTAPVRWLTQVDLQSRPKSFLHATMSLRHMVFRAY